MGDFPFDSNGLPTTLANPHQYDNVHVFTLSGTILGARRRVPARDRSFSWATAGGVGLPVPPSNPKQPGKQRDLRAAVRRRRGCFQ